VTYAYLEIVSGLTYEPVQISAVKGDCSSCFATK
jgi:hypothetical protein